MNLTKMMIMLLLIVLVISIPVGTVFAHRMVIEELEAGLVKIGYEDGRFSRRTEIVVYNEQGMELQRGMIDTNGQFSYQPEEVVLIVADDGLGHRAELNLGQEVEEELPRGLTVSLVFSAFVLFAGVFQNRLNHKKKKSGEV